MVFIKDVSGNADAGTAQKWGGNDINYLDDYFDDVDITPKVARINTRTYFRSGKFELRDSNNTHSFIFITGDLTANRNVNVPATTGDVTLMFSPFETYFDLKEIAEPATPSSNTVRLFIDSADGRIKIKRDDGDVVVIE